MSAATVPQSTIDVIRNSTFSLSDAVYFFVKAGRVDEHSDHLAVMNDRMDRTVITTEAGLQCVEVLGRNSDRWSLLSIVCANPFYCVGFIASIANAFTEAGVDFCFLSAFTQDLLLVKEAQRDHAAKLLVQVGFRDIR